MGPRVLVSWESIWYGVRVMILEEQTHTSSLILNVTLGTQNPGFPKFWPQNLATQPVTSILAQKTKQLTKL